MKQVMQNMANGETSIIEAPAPVVAKGQVVIASTVSLISVGTERMLVDFGRANLLQKARQQPEKVKQVLQKVKTDGIFTTLDAVRSKLAQPLPLGYCNVGRVVAADSKCVGLLPGDRVVSNGPHADVVRVPFNLTAKIPDEVDDESAAFTVVASIGLQGIRLAEPTLGEYFVVTGAGLIGLLTVQLLRAHGCKVLAIDFDESKLALARAFGASTCNPSRGEDPVSVGIAFSKGRGVDGVIITASTKSNDPVRQAAQMCRKRGRIVLVGVTGLALNRADFYEKELQFQVSCSYGPGRYDSKYEQQGLDYPIGFVRWTEQRNFEAVLDMMVSGQLNVKPLITHRFLFEEAPSAYKQLSEDRTALGVLLRYESEPHARLSTTVELTSHAPERGAATEPLIGFVGAGNYASRMLIPAFRAASARLHTIVSSGGVNGVVHGKAMGFARASSDSSELFNDPSVNTVVIATRHDSHASFAVKAINANKHVFVEKPLAMTSRELDEVKTAYQAPRSGVARPLVMVGFNRRFSPHIQKMKALLAAVHEPKVFIMTVNAGYIPIEHWTQDPDVGGGRIIGEACHFIDLLRFLAENPITHFSARRIGDSPGILATEDKAVITLSFSDGSLGTIHYLANGHASYPKERLEVFCAGKVLQLDNFRRLSGYGWGSFRKLNLWRQDKGQNAAVAAFIHAIRTGGPSPIPFEELMEVARVTISVSEMLRTQK